MLETMKQIILIVFSLIFLLPVSAQVSHQELGNKLDAAIRKAQKEHRAKVMAEQQHAQERAAEVENRTQLGLQRNQQQVQRLQDNYGVDDLRQRNASSRPRQRRIQKTQVRRLQRTTPVWTRRDGQETTGYAQSSGRGYPSRIVARRPMPSRSSRPPRTPRMPYNNTQRRNKTVVYRAALGQFPPKVTPRRTVPSGTTRRSSASTTPRRTMPSGTTRRSSASTTPRRTMPSGTTHRSSASTTARPKVTKDSGNFFNSKGEQIQTITWRNVKPGMYTKDVGITSVVMQYNNELMYHVGSVNGRFSTQNRAPLRVVKRGDYYIVKSSRVLRK